MTNLVWWFLTQPALPLRALESTAAVVWLLPLDWGDSGLLLRHTGANGRAVWTAEGRDPG